MRDLLLKAADFIAIANDWNFTEAEIGGEMVSASDLQEELTAAALTFGGDR